MDLEIQETRNGRGVVAMREFAAGEVFYEITGTFITGDEDEEIEDSIRDNAFRYSKEFYISPAGSIGDFQNHSCEPNAKVEKRSDRLYVVATGLVQRGEEVLIDYSTITGSDDVWEMNCNCGTDGCRMSVRRFDTLPPELQKNIVRMGWCRRTYWRCKKSICYIGTMKAIATGVVHAVPADLKKALMDDRVAFALWDGLTPLARNEWICWTISVKKEETRKEHVKRVTRQLKDGKRRPCCWIGCIHRTDKAISPSIKGVVARHAK